MRTQTLLEISPTELQELFRKELAPIESRLSQLQQQQQPAPKQPEAEQLLTAEQAAELLHLKVRTVYLLKRLGHLPSCKRGKRLYFSRTELLNWVKQSRTRTAAEIEAAADNYLKKKGGSQ